MPELIGVGDNVQVFHRGDERYLEHGKVIESQGGTFSVIFSDQGQKTYKRTEVVKINYPRFQERFVLG